MSTHDRTGNTGGGVERTVRLRVEFGRGLVARGDLARLAAGSVIPLDQAADEDVEVWTEDGPAACGQALVLDGKIAVRLREVTKAESVDAE